MVPCKMRLLGSQLAIALERTEGSVALVYNGKQTARLTAPEAAKLVANRDDYYGDGSKRRVKAIVYVPPAPAKPPSITDSGFSLAPYPMPSQSTAGKRFPALSRNGCGVRDTRDDEQIAWHKAAIEEYMAGLSEFGIDMEMI